MKPLLKEPRISISPLSNQRKAPSWRLDYHTDAKSAKLVGVAVLQHPATDAMQASALQCLVFSSQPSPPILKVLDDKGLGLRIIPDFKPLRCALTLMRSLCSTSLGPLDSDDTDSQGVGFRI